MTKNRIILIGFLTLAAINLMGAVATQITTYSDGSILTASQLNNEFGNLYSTINSLDNANIVAGANIDPLKIAATIDADGITRNVSTGALSVNPDNSTIEISADTVALKNDGTTGTKLADAVAANGLSKNGSENLQVNVDDSTIEISSDSLRVKDSGITSAKILNSTITASDLAADSVDTSEIVADAVGASEIAEGAVGASELDLDVDGDEDAACSTASATTCLSYTFTQNTSGATILGLHCDSDGADCNLYGDYASYDCDVIIRVNGSDRFKLTASQSRPVSLGQSWTFLTDITAGSTTITVVLDDIAGSGGGQLCHLDNYALRVLEL